MAQLVHSAKSSRRRSRTACGAGSGQVLELPVVEIAGHDHERNVQLARELTVFLGRHAPTVLASSVAEAGYTLADHGSWSGVVTEMRLPDGSGIEFLERLLEGAVTAPPAVIVLSALEDSENIERCRSLGARDYLTKPVDLDVLRKRVEEVLASDESSGSGG